MVRKCIMYLHFTWPCITFNRENKIHRIKSYLGSGPVSESGSGSIITEADPRIRIKMIRIRNTNILNWINKVSRLLFDLFISLLSLIPSGLSRLFAASAWLEVSTGETWSTTKQSGSQLIRLPNSWLVLNLYSCFTMENIGVKKNKQSFSPLQLQYCNLPLKGDTLKKRCKARFWVWDPVLF